MKAEPIDYKNNSLNVFRLLAAIQVLWGHVLTHLDISNIPLLGDFVVFFSGVPIFFTLSGYLIWHSIGRSKTFCEYAQKRFWRIYPELWVAVLVELVVLLFLYSQYHPIDWSQMGLFTFGQMTIFQFWTPEFLREYGCGTPNGALWTITVLIQFYLCAYLLYNYLKGRKILVWWLAISISILVGWWTPAIQSLMPTILAKLYGVSLIPYLWMFLVSAFAAEHRNKILPLLKKFFWIFITLLILKRYVIMGDMPVGMYELLDTILLFLGIVGLSYAVPQINVKTDISYGIYIYHMTIVNALIELGFVGKDWALWAVLIGSCLIAWISAKTIGGLSVKKKRQISAS